MTRLNISFCAIAKPVMLIYHQLLKTTPTWWKWILMRFCFLLLKIIQGLLMSLEPFWDTLYIFKQRATQRYFWCFLLHFYLSSNSNVLINCLEFQRKTFILTFSLLFYKKEVYVCPAHICVKVCSYKVSVKCLFHQTFQLKTQGKILNFAGNIFKF